jgi:hypothetical protein
MGSKFYKNLVPLTAIVTSTLLGFGYTGIANAASTTTQASQAPAQAAPVSITMQQLDERVAKLPALASLKNGDMLTISDDGSVTGAVWQGTYVYHPAGSVVPATAMYVRWKDGLVTLTPTPATATNAAPGTLDANWVAQNVFSGTVLSNYQTQATLANEPTDSTVLRIPGNAWLFRVNSDGQYTALVDTFVFVSGSQPLYPNPDKNNELEANGSQPVPVSSGYWQSQ